MFDKKKKRDADCPDRVLEKIAIGAGATIERDIELGNVSIVFSSGQKITARNNTLLLQKTTMMLAVLLQDGELV